jgi:hypothetical protein
MVTWSYLPAEIRLLILGTLLQNYFSMAPFAAVSREWQAVIEPHYFARIYLTPSRLTDVDTILRRSRALVGYIWFCIALENYDLSVYSPSDSAHWFKYLTCNPDTPSGEYNQNGHLDQVARVDVDDHQRIWNAGTRNSATHKNAIEKVFEEIMGEEPCSTDGEEWQWFRQLPPVPAVTGFLLRKQTRRRWKPLTLLEMIARFPKLEEVQCELWREWADWQQRRTDGCKHCFDI